jgi:methyltransferase OMS1
MSCCINLDLTGTGRNLPYYPSSCDLYVSDVSKEMVAVAQGKAEKKNIRANFVVMDACQLDFADNTFDTIVDTFGLCSFENEGKVLAEMKRVCKPGGKILLLEHGRSHYQWLNDILDENEERHASQWGCVWNKDISKLVADAGLALESNWRFHFGTSYFIVGTNQE